MPRLLAKQRVGSPPSPPTPSADGQSTVARFGLKKKTLSSEMDLDESKFSRHYN
jgi:hypothetical protein